MCHKVGPKQRKNARVSFYGLTQFPNQIPSGPLANLLFFHHDPPHLEVVIGKKKRSGGLGFPGGPVVKNLPANEETWV